MLGLKGIIILLCFIGFIRWAWDCVIDTFNDINELIDDMKKDE